MRKQIKFRDRLFDIKMIMEGNLKANEEGHFDPLNDNTYLWQIFIDNRAIDVKPRRNTDENLLLIMTLEPPLEIHYHPITLIF